MNYRLIEQIATYQHDILKNEYNPRPYFIHLDCIDPSSLMLRKIYNPLLNEEQNQHVNPHYYKTAFWSSDWVKDEVLEKYYAEHICSEQYKIARFGIETTDEKDIFTGYTNGATWNGWSCPWFTKEEGLKLVERFNHVSDTFSLYSEKIDSFMIPNENGDEIEYEEFKGEDRFINGITMRVYPIGSWCWVWTEVEPNYEEYEDYEEVEDDI